MNLKKMINQSREMQARLDAEEKAVADAPVTGAAKGVEITFDHTGTAISASIERGLEGDALANSVVTAINDGKAKLEEQKHQKKFSDMPVSPSLPRK